MDRSSPSFNSIFGSQLRTFLAREISGFLWVGSSDGKGCSTIWDDESILDTTLSSDGIHINEKGYEIWVSAIRPIIDRLNQQTI